MYLTAQGGGGGGGLVCKGAVTYYVSDGSADSGLTLT